MPRADAIDISRHNGPGVDWPTIAQHVDTAAVKATQGSDFVDPTFGGHRAGMAAAKLKRRFLYHWLTPDSDRRGDAVAQARHYLRTIGTLATGEGVLLDFEQGGVTVQQATPWCDTVEATTGRPVVVYLGRYAAGSTAYFDATLFNGKRGRWLAAYVTEERARAATAPVGWDAWQWTSTGSIPGVADPTIDLSQIDRPALLDAACGITPHHLEDDVTTIYRFTDANAVMVTRSDTRGPGIFVEWSGSGNDPKVVPWLVSLVACGAKEVTGTVASLCPGLWFVGNPAVVQDSKHKWTGDEFRGVLPQPPTGGAPAPQKFNIVGVATAA